MEPNSEILKDLFRYKMPFGKYEGRYIGDLPEHYILWFSQKGFPKGKLGILLQTMYEIKLNGLSYLLNPIREMMQKQ
ncbi:MAG TPA: DUF3820 family protein [Edaphocola sp.]|nr:DUF3820 family protein [Edaphocola sp.]